MAGRKSERHNGGRQVSHEDEKSIAIKVVKCKECEWAGRRKFVLNELIIQDPCPKCGGKVF